MAIRHNHTAEKIKSERYKVSLAQIQSGLGRSQQTFSKIVHQSAIEKISEFLAITIARPSGVLGGSIVSLAGGLAIISIAKRVGFKVPSSILLIMFVIGFILGLLVEAINKFRKQK